MSAFQREGVKLVTLVAGPEMSRILLGIAKGKSCKDANASTYLGMVAVFEGCEGYILLRYYVFPEFPGKYPPHIQIVLKESVYRVGCAVFLLSTCNIGEPPFSVHQRGLTAIPACNHKVFPVSGYDYLLRIFEIEVDLWKEIFQFRLKPHPDRVLGERVRPPFYDIWERAACFCYIFGQILRSLFCPGRCILI